METTRIETEIWVPDEERPGYSRLVRRRTVGEVYRDLCDALEHDDWGYVSEPGCEEYLHMHPRSHEEWPEGRLVCFAVKGGSEGHYVHVSVAREGDHDAWSDCRLVFLGKTFHGWDAAWSCAKRFAELLGGDWS